LNRLRDKLTLPSRLRYLIWRTGALGKEVTVKLASGERLILSGLRYELGTAYDIFVNEAYRFPRPIDSASIKRIVDVGANVGHSILYWAPHFPEARIEAFEPHPVHLDLLRRTIALNHLTDRVTVYDVAAGTRGGRAELADHGTASAIIAEDGPGGALRQNIYLIEVADFFEVIGEARVDLLKLDCEGAEFDLLMDERFEQLDVRNLVMEWHETAAHPTAERDLSSRLLELGWELQTRLDTVNEPLEGTDLMRAGLIWAFPRRHQTRLQQG
jgi:FkbM family methyltransferase